MKKPLSEQVVVVAGASSGIGRAVAQRFAREGWLVGLDRVIGKNFRIGVGYNFTDFSDDMTNLRYDNKGWFLNIVGYY